MVQAKKAKQYINKLDTMPPSLKRFILNQIGKDITAKDFYVYESAVLYAQGLLYEALKKYSLAKQKYSQAGLVYSGNMLALDRIEFLSKRKM